MFEFHTIKHDITSDVDVHLLVKTFSEKAIEHSLLHHGSTGDILFSDKWMMASFWCSVLFDHKPSLHHPSANYAFLSLPSEHMNNWIHLFFEAVDEHFQGPLADSAKMKASHIAHLANDVPANLAYNL